MFPFNELAARYMCSTLNASQDIPCRIYTLYYFWLDVGWNSVRKNCKQSGEGCRLPEYHLSNCTMYTYEIRKWDLSPILSIHDGKPNDREDGRLTPTSDGDWAKLRAHVIVQDCRDYSHPNRGKPIQYHSNATIPTISDALRVAAYKNLSC